MANNNIQITVQTNAENAGKSFESLGSSISRSIAQANKLDKSFKFLDRAVNSGKIDLQQYASMVDKLDKEQTQLYASLGRTTGAVNSQSNTMSRAAASAEDMAAGQRRAGKDTNRFGVAMQQTGYQVGDFLVQIQSGTNVFVAFGQQMTQLVGILPMFNSFMGLSGTALIGLSAGLGIVIPLVTAIGAAFMRAGSEAESAFESMEQGLDDLDKKLNSTGETVGSFVALTASLNEDELKRTWEGLGETAVESFQGTFLQNFANFFKNNINILNPIPSLASSYKGWGQSLGEVTAEEFAEAFGTNASLIPALENIQEALASQNIQDLDRMILELSAFESKASSAGKQFLADLIKSLDLAKGYTEEVKSFAEEIKEASNAGETLAGLDLEIPIGAAAKVAEVLAANMNIALSDALSLVNLASAAASGPVQGGRGRSPGAGYTATERILMSMGGEVGIPKRTSPSGGGGGGSTVDPVAQLRKQLELERELVGVSEDRARVIRALGVEFVQKNPEIAEGLQEQISKTKELNEIEKERQSILQTVETSLENGLMTMVEGTKSVKDAFKDMARAIIKELYDVYVVQRLVGGFGQSGGSGSGLIGLLGGLFGKASGGTVMSNQPYLVGEKGPELIVPRNRGHVMNADLTADALGGGNGVTVVQNFYFQANGDDSVKKLIAQAAPSIANMAKQSVMDSRRRGGAMKNAFG